MSFNIKIVLVEPSHPGNIGACARAMKNMRVQELALVNPRVFPSQEAYVMASRADDILHNATCYASTQEAIADCHFVIGTSARLRHYSCEVISAYQLGDLVKKQLQHNNKIAVLFGAERTGLSNDDLALCHRHVFVPCNPDYCSLNLAAAVQILCYEIMRSCDVSDFKKEHLPEPIYPPHELLEQFFDHLHQVLRHQKFLPQDNLKLLNKLKNLYNRAQLTAEELQIMRGILTSIKKYENTKEPASIS